MKSNRLFSGKVLRPLGQQLDRIEPGQVIAADWKLWQVLAEIVAGVDA